MKFEYEVYRLCRNQATMDKLRREEKKYELPKNNYVTGIDIYEFLNRIIQNCKSDYVLICHDDVILPESIDFNIDNCINSANKFLGSDNWGVVGNAGVSVLSKECITFISDPHTRIIPFRTEHPQLVESVDGNTMLLNLKNIRKRKIQLPKSLNGFHLYDLILCMELYKNGLICCISSWLYVKHLSPGNYLSFLDATHKKSFQDYFRKEWRNHTITTINGPIEVEQDYKNFINNEKLGSFEDKINKEIIRVFENREVEINILTRLHIKSLKIYRLLDSVRILKKVLPKGVTLNLYLAVNCITEKEIKEFIQTIKEDYKDINITEKYIKTTGKYPRHEAIKEIIKVFPDNNSFTWIVDYDDFVMPSIAPLIKFLLSDTDILIGSSAIFEELWNNESTIPQYSTFKTMLNYTNGYYIYDGINKTPVCSVIFRTKIVKDIFRDNIFIGDYYEDYTILLLASMNHDIKAYPVLFAGISSHKDNTIAEVDRTHWDYSYSSFLSYLVNKGLIKKNYHDFYKYTSISNQEVQRLLATENEFNSFKSGAIWKILQKYRKLKNKLQNLIKNGDKEKT